MAQRRVASASSSTSAKADITVVRQTTPEPIPVAPMSLELDGDDEDQEEMVPLSAEEAYEIQKHNLRLKHWRESPFAIGLTEVTWHDEKNRGSDYGQGYGDDEVERDHSGCLCVSAHICSRLGAGRVGNMVVLRTSQEWVDEEYEDEETGEIASRRVSKPKLDLLVGPYWPMLVCVTYPLIFCVSGWALWSGILSGKPKPISLIWIWSICTGGLIIALALTACRDPGIMYRHPKPLGGSWRWSDQARTYRPRGAYYDPDTAVMVEGFDHTCPWTGTAIGKKNMIAFQTFVCLVFVCMILDIFILTGVFD